MLTETQMELLPESMRCWFDEAYCLEAVLDDGYELRYVQNQTDELCLAAVIDEGFALQYVHNQTAEICITAIGTDWESIRYVRNQTLELCLAAIRKTPQAIIYVKFHQLSSVEIDMLLKEYQMLLLGGNHVK